MPAPTTTPERSVESWGRLGHARGIGVRTSRVVHLRSPQCQGFAAAAAVFPDADQLASGGAGQTRPDGHGRLCRLSRFGFVPNLLAHQGADG